MADETKSDRELIVLQMIKGLIDTADKDKVFVVSDPLRGSHYGKAGHMLIYHARTRNSYVIRIEEL